MSAWVFGGVAGSTASNRGRPHSTPQHYRTAHIQQQSKSLLAQVIISAPSYPPPHIQSVLKPELPEDVALYFHISSSLLVLTVLAVTARGGVREMKDIESNSWMGALL